MVRTLVSVLLTLPLLWVLWVASFHQPPLPTLQTLVPLEGRVQAWRERLSPGRSSFRYIELRVRDVPTTFVVNLGDLLDDDSAAFQAVRSSLRLDQPLRLWARVAPPTPLDMLASDYDPARYADHRLGPAADNPWGLGNYAATADTPAPPLMPRYEVLQLELDGRALLRWEQVAAGHRSEERLFKCIFLGTALLLVLLVGRLLLLGLAILHALVSERRARR